MIDIKIKTFGIFSEILGNEINFKIEKELKLKELRAIILKNFFEKKINNLEDTFNKSVFSSEIEILKEDYIIKKNEILYLLPPFSGG